MNQRPFFKTAFKWVSVFLFFLFSSPSFAISIDSDMAACLAAYTAYTPGCVFKGTSNCRVSVMHGAFSVANYPSRDCSEGCPAPKIRIAPSGECVTPPDPVCVLPQVLFNHSCVSKPVCAASESYDVATNTCIPIQCVSGQYLSPQTHQCEPLPTCPDTASLDPVTHQCVPLPTCIPPEYRHADTNLCVAAPPCSTTSIGGICTTSGDSCSGLQLAIYAPTCSSDPNSPDYSPPPSTGTGGDGTGTGGTGGDTGTGSGSGTGDGTGSGSGSGSGSGTGDGTGSGSGSGTGDGTGSGSGTGDGTGSGSGSGSGTGDGTGSGSGSGTGDGTEPPPCNSATSVCSSGTYSPYTKGEQGNFNAINDSGNQMITDLKTELETTFSDIKTSLSTGFSVSSGSSQLPAFHIGNVQGVDVTIDYSIYSDKLIIVSQIILALGYLIAASIVLSK